MSVILVDTHCHIHESAFAVKFEKSTEELLAEAKAEGVGQLICIGTDVKSSREAVEFAAEHKNCYATLAIHPHEAQNFSLEELNVQMAELEKLAAASPKRLVGIGECGLDYYYHDDVAVLERQRYLLRRHIELAQKYDLPLVFHVREAFDDFFKIVDSYTGIKGVVHSFTADKSVLEGVLKRGLLVGLNGIMTFTKSSEQLASAKAVPLEKLVVETDAPFLTPTPFRGKMCEPKHVRVTAEFLSKLRGETLDQLAEATTHNARTLFGIK